MQYRRHHRGFTPEAVADIRHRYVDTDEPQSSIAADYHVHRKTIDELCKREGWPRRKDRAPRDMPADLRMTLEAESAVRTKAEATIVKTQSGKDEHNKAEEPAGAFAPAGSSVADRLEQQVEEQLSAVELKRAMRGSEPQSSAEAEHTTRMLERLADTLSKVRRLRSPDLSHAGTNDFDDMPRDIDEFRNQLAQRIENFVRSWSAEAVPATGNPAEGAPPQS